MRSALARAVLTAMLTFALDEPPPWHRSVQDSVAAVLIVDEWPADLVVLDPAGR